MISYKPLERILRDRGINYTLLSEMLGLTKSDLSLILNKRVSRTDLIERICSVLECDIQNVIEYSEEEVQEKYIVVNWDKFLKMCEQRGTTKTALTRELKLSKNFFSTAIQRNSKVKSTLLEDICSLLNCTEQDIV